MSQPQVAAPAGAGAPGPSDGPRPTASPNPFKSKQSSINKQRSPTPKASLRKSPHIISEPIPTLTFTNSRSSGGTGAEQLAAQVERLELTLSSETEGPVTKSKGRNAKRKQAAKEQKLRVQIPHSIADPPPQLKVDANQVKEIQDLFAKNIAPLYATSSPQFLDNMSHHPHFQYMHGMHQTPRPQSTVQLPTVKSHGLPSAPAHQPKQEKKQTNNSQKNITQTPEYLEKINVLLQNTQVRNGVPQSPQYLQNLMQHPLLCRSVSIPQPEPEEASSEKSVKRKNRRKRQRSHKKVKDEHIFEDYITIEEVEKGLKNNSLIQGVLRINPKQYQRAYLSDKDRNEKDIFVDGIKNRNRALEGDIVVLKLITEDEQELANDTNEIEDNIEESNDFENVKEQNEEKLDESDDVENKEEVKSQRRGKVVFIKEKVHQRTCIGHLRLMPDKNRQKALFAPRDFRVPRLNIPFTSWPDNFYKDFKSYEKVLFLAQILDWQDTRFALGTIIKNIGQVGDIQTETKALLAENELDITPYGPEVREFFPRLDFTIPEEEIALREDCRKECVFSIDPYNCRDIDDAVSCRLLNNGNYEIGVHISDVGYFLKENTILDKRVADKATTIYLVEKAYHMLPEELCMLCSLFPGVDKLAFSVFWEITEDGKVLSHRFTRTVIQSCAQLAYEHAQAILEDREPGNEFPEIYNNWKYDDIKNTIKILGKISDIFRRNRYNNGALKIDQPKVSFKLDPANGLPVSFSVYESQESHQLIEEFMLLANMTVAQRIHDDHPRLAFLRCHPPPSKFMLEELEKSLKPMGIELNISSAGTLYSSLLPHIGPDCENRQKAIVLSMLCTKPMTRAKYFCADGWDDEDFGHYALNAPLYTHFTSPIRRYADIMVHRLLAASLNYTNQPDWEVDRVRWIAANCNKQKYNAKKAGEMSTELYTLKYIEMHSPVLTEAVVVDVREKFFDVIIVAMSLNRRIYMNNGAPENYKCIKNDAGSKLSKLVITWPKTDDLPEIEQTIEVFSVIQVEMIRGGEMVKVETKLVRPCQERTS